LKIARANLIAVSLVVGWLLTPIAVGATITIVPNSGKIASDCEAHVLDNLDRELVARCGNPIALSGKRPSGWIETPSSITPFLTEISAPGEIQISVLIPSGRVTVPPDSDFPAGERIRLISLEAPPSDGISRSLFERDLTSSARSVPMPAGSAIGILIDSKGEALALSRPFRVAAGAVISLWPQPPDRGNSDLLLRLQWPRAAAPERDRVKIALQVGAAPREPDVTVASSGSLLVVWYALPAMNGRLLLDSPELRLERDAVALRSRAVTIVNDDLVVLPRLTVAISPMPRKPESMPAPMSLTVSPLENEKKVLRTLQVEAGKSYVLESLPASVLSIRLHGPDFVIRKQVDLSAGADSSVTITLDPMVIAGTVYDGDVPAQAELHFIQDEQSRIVKTDDSGSYSVTLWQQGRYVVETTLPQQPDMPPFSQSASITRSQSLDIHIPANRLSAHVYDANTPKTIEGARIGILNRWNDEFGSHSSGTSIVTRGDLTNLPPQHVGTSTISIHADGYSDPPPLSITIDETTGQRVVEFPLHRKPAEEGADVHLFLGDNVTPASGAEMAAWEADGEIAWIGTADDSGHITVPQGMLGRLLVVRHPQAVSTVMSFISGEHQMSLGPISAPPILVTVVHKDQKTIGTAPAMLTIWLGAFQLTSDAAAFATWSSGATSGDGTWIGRQLHASPFRLLFTRNVSGTQIASGALDRLATVVPYPWPASTTVALANE